MVMELNKQRQKKLQKLKKRGADPLSIAKRMILQVKLIQSLSNAVLGWVAFSSLLFWLDESAIFWTASGILFTVIGIFIIADVFGIAMFLTHKAFLLLYISKHQTIPQPSTLKKSGYIITLVWLSLMLLFTHYIFDLMYELITSLFTF